MLSFSEYFQLNESVESVELMSTIRNQAPRLDVWNKQFEEFIENKRLSGKSGDWTLVDFLDTGIIKARVDKSQIQQVINNLKLFKSPVRIKSIIDRATIKIPQKFRIVLNDVISDSLFYTKQQKEAITPTKGMITLVIRPDDDPITVWMIGHKIGHAFTNELGDGYRIIAKLVERYILDLKKYHGITIPSWGLDFLKQYNKLSGFRSASSNQVVNFVEYINELIAQYCHHGRVSFVVPPEIENLEESEKVKFHEEKEKIEKEINNFISDHFNKMEDVVYFV